MNRRTFLSHSSLAASGALLASLPSPNKASEVQKSDGATYAPQGKPKPVVKAGDFNFAAVHLDHGHIYGQCNGLLEAGGGLSWVYEPDVQKREAFLKRFPQAKVARALGEILADPSVHLVAAAAVTNLRGPLGCEVMAAGKHYFTDKAPFTTLEQLAEARRVAGRTGKKYMVYYGERLHVEAAMHATDLVQAGAIGRVVQVLGLGPHRLNKASRPDWFFEREKFGGILCDIGSHQFEQFLTYASASEAEVVQSAVGNFDNPDKPEFEDFGLATLVASNGASNQVRVDWYTPKGLSSWGDGRTFILGTKGFIELRKYLDLAREKRGNHVFLVDDSGEHYLNVEGQVGFRFFGELILDCLQGTEKAMTQAHAFKAAELSLLAQAKAQKLLA